MNDAALLHDLEPTAVALYERHLATARTWYPHEVVPWDMARGFADHPWAEDQFPLPEAVRSALFVNTLTEDNLPYYFQTIDRVFGSDGVWRDWSHRWTAEEGRHATAMRDYLMVTRAIDPVALEQGRMAQMSGGHVPSPTSVEDGFVYVALQELATRVAHRNTGKALLEHADEHPAAQCGYDLMVRVATDENYHYLFYRDLTTAALEIAPSRVMAALERQVRNFEMPGAGIPGFKRHADAIARAGVFGLVEHYNNVLVPLVHRKWQVEHVQGLDAEGEQARDRLVEQVGRIGKVARRVAERAREATARAGDRAKDAREKVTVRARDARGRALDLAQSRLASSERRAAGQPPAWRATASAAARAASGSSDRSSTPLDSSGEKSSPRS